MSLRTRPDVADLSDADRENRIFFTSYLSVISVCSVAKHFLPTKKA